MRKFLIKYSENGFKHKGFVEGISIADALKKFAEFKKPAMKLESYAMIPSDHQNLFKDLKKIC